ncbi:uncharacterized protein LOC143449006 isoform X3 [Clavelina lepadiformis]|uniref:uncharacterized protein LOC143449006 isoform X3 n=1 Tax=Clavelina lepadiformis TaxID=159417 RepID=UPI004040FDC8
MYFDDHCCENGEAFGIRQTSLLQHSFLSEQTKYKDIMLTRLPEEEEHVNQDQEITPANLHSILNNLEQKQTALRDHAVAISADKKNSRETPTPGTDATAPAVTALDEIDNLKTVEPMQSAVEISHYPIRRMPSYPLYASAVNSVSEITSQNQGCCCRCHCQYRPTELGTKEFYRSHRLETAHSLPSYTNRSYIDNAINGRRPWLMQSYSMPAMSPPQREVPHNRNNHNTNNNKEITPTTARMNGLKNMPTESDPDVEQGREPNGTVASVSADGESEGHLYENMTENNVESNPQISENKEVEKHLLACCMVNKGLVALVIILVIITLSTLTSLVYFVVFGNKNDGVQTTSTTALHLPNGGTITGTAPPASHQLNQTSMCGYFPRKYIQTRGASRSFSEGSNYFFDPPPPINESAWQQSLNDSGHRVVGGVPTNIVQNPWQVSLWLSPPGKRPAMKCGASIVMADWVITAAHCTFGRLNPSDWVVYMGTSALSLKDRPPAQKRGVTFIKQHEEYENDQSFDYDISLMKLDRSLEFSSFIQPICIPPQGFVFPDGMACYVTGWGTSEDSTTATHPDILQQAQVDIIGNKTCKQEDWLADFVTDRMICAGKPEGQRDACQGDSGGPLSCYLNDTGAYVLAGIVSWGFGCGLAKLPGVYTEVSFFTDWIWENIGKQDGYIQQ